MARRTRTPIIDCDIHNTYTPEILAPFLPAEWRRHQEQKDDIARMLRLKDKPPEEWRALIFHSRPNWATKSRIFESSAGLKGAKVRSFGIRKIQYGKLPSRLSEEAADEFWKDSFIRQAAEAKEFEDSEVVSLKACQRRDGINHIAARCDILLKLHQEQDMLALEAMSPLSEPADSALGDSTEQDSAAGDFSSEEATPERPERHEASDAPASPPTLKEAAKKTAAKEAPTKTTARREARGAVEMFDFWSFAMG